MSHPSNRPTQESLDTLFTYHAPTQEQVVEYETIRGMAKAFAEVVLDRCPPCADTSAAIRSIREAVMWANAAIATNRGGDEG